MRILFFLAATALAADKAPVAKLLEMARRPDTAFRDALVATFGAAALKNGTAQASQGPEFLFALETRQTPAVSIDDGPSASLTPVRDSDLWFFTARLAAGRSHSVQYTADGKPFGGRRDLSAYLPESDAQPGVPQGKLSEKLVHTSKIYDGMRSDYWIYVPAQYDPGAPAALMVWQDGEGHINRDGAARTLNVIDNLIYQKKIPVVIQVFISPGNIGERRMRSIEYDTVNDTYARFLRDEILADVQAKYNIRRDAYSRAVAGNSSGGICAFNVAWHQPDQFSRVLSRIGSFTSIQWKPGVIDGGNLYPFKIRKEPKRNIRVWLQDGSEDLENDHGSWPLQNIQMANSLKMRGYDFHFSWGNGAHNGAHANAEAPLALTWLWRDYDALKTEQIYEQDEAEKALPYFRVKIHNRQ